MSSFKTIITGTGSYIPSEMKANTDFALHNFYAHDFTPIKTPATEVAEKFKKITGIEERRYVPSNMTASDIGYIAAQEAIDDAGIDPETIDQIIVAHNFGNVITKTIQTDAVPALASRIKNQLNILNPQCIGYDILFGCPGWLQGVIQAHAFFQAGMAKNILVIGTETLSRVIDAHDRDSMIFSDGAGASLLQAADSNTESGILGSAAQSHCSNELDFINMGKSYFPDSDPAIRYLKMKGRKVYEYAIIQVPNAMKLCLENSNVAITDLKKIFIHQANEKMDEVIIRNFYKLFGIADIPKNIMPMNIRELGNSSVATIPTLLDMVRKNQIPDHHIQAGDIIMFASVGAGMNINAVCYKV